MPSKAATALKTLTASAVTSGPVPSPPTTATRRILLLLTILVFPGNGVRERGKMERGNFGVTTERAIAVATPSATSDRRRPLRQLRNLFLPQTALPGEVGKGLVSVGHTVDVFALRVGGAFAVIGLEELAGKLLVHRPSLFLTAGPQDPADGQRLLPSAIDLH